MSPATYQTIKLGKGKHSSPDDGACVMELASMLAGEAFTDHPECVCPAIGSFLRAYNDSVDDARRQDLYEYAARVVGSRRGPDVAQARADRLLAWGGELQPRRLTRLLPAPLRTLASARRPPADAAGTHAVHAIRKHTDATHAAALALIDELLAIGPSAPSAALTPSLESRAIEPTGA
ncbi:MAG TPA: hypothetical protein VGI87_04815 [Solirubrobacteraceae bacterium]|jgi:hypothetical protein